MAERTVRAVEALDHPIPFLFFTTIGVIAMMAFIAWMFSALNMTGPLGLVKGGRQG